MYGYGGGLRPYDTAVLRLLTEDVSDSKYRSGAGDRAAVFPSSVTLVTRRTILRSNPPTIKIITRGFAQNMRQYCRHILYRRSFP